MAFRWFRKNEEEEVRPAVLTDKMCEAPFSKILASFPEDEIEDIVADNFDRILKHRFTGELYYFTLYPKWRAKIGENLLHILDKISYLDDIVNLISLFPQYAGDIYSYLLETWLNDFQYGCLRKESIDNFVDDILLPMADWEMNNFYFPEIREKAVEIVEQTESYKEMWDVIDILENRFNIPRETFSEYLHNLYEDFIFYYLSQSHHKTIHFYSWNDMQDLEEFFRDREAYEYFMDQLPEIISVCGIDVYALLLRLLGPIPELTSRYAYCSELCLEPTAPESNAKLLLSSKKEIEE